MQGHPYRDPDSYSFYDDDESSRLNDSFRPLPADEDDFGMQQNLHNTVPSDTESSEVIPVTRSHQRMIVEDLLAETEKSHRLYLKKIARTYFPALVFGTTSIGVGFTINYLLSQVDNGAALSAANLISTFDTSLIVVSTGMLYGSAGEMMSKEYGAFLKGRKNISKRVIGETLRSSWMVALLGSPVFIALSFAIPPGLRHAGISSNNINFVTEYFSLSFISIIPRMLATVSQQFVIGVNMNSLTMIPALINIITAVILGYELILHLGHGVEGAAETRISIASLFFLFYMFCFLHKDFSDFAIFRRQIDWGKVKTIAIQSVVVALAMGIELVPLMLMAVWTGQYSDIDLGAQNVALQYNMLSYIPIFAAQQTANTIVSQYKGAKYYKGARRFGNRIVAYTAVLSLAISSLVILMRKQIANSYLEDDISDRQAKLDLSQELLIITAIFQIIDSIRVVTTGCQQAIKDMKYNLINSLVTLMALGLPLSWVLCFVANLGAKGIALAHGTAIVASTISLRYRWGKKSTPQALGELAVDESEGFSRSSQIQEASDGHVVAAVVSYSALWHDSMSKASKASSKQSQTPSSTHSQQVKEEETEEVIKTNSNQSSWRCGIL